jgi:hypothetical protein
MRETVKVNACTDCYQVSANGYSGLDLTEERTAEIEAGFHSWVDAGWPQEHPGGCDCETYETGCEGHFSYRGCDICKSGLGGNFYPVTFISGETA